MPISVRCPGCGKALTVKDEFAGKKGKCPSCGQIVLIPPSETVPEQDGLLEVQAPSRPSLVRPSLPSRSVQRPRAERHRIVIWKVVVGALLLPVGGFMVWFVAMGTSRLSLPNLGYGEAKLISLVWAIVATALGWVFCRSGFWIQLLYAVIATGLVPGLVILKAWEAIVEGMSGRAKE